MAPPGKDVYRRNGKELSWASFKMKIDNDEFFGIAEVNGEEKLEKALVRGTGRSGAPRGKTAGIYSVEGTTMKLYKASAASLIEKLALSAPDQTSYGGVEFFLSLEYVEDDVSVLEELYKCEFTGRKFAVAQGSDPLTDEIPFMCEYMKLSTGNVQGMTLFDNRQRRY